MEEHSSVDISIRNVAVRLNDPNIAGSEMNGECVNSLYIPSSNDSETRLTNFKDFGNSCSSSSDICDEVREKLHVCHDNTGNCSLLNGCNKFLHDDMKCVDFSVNGLSNCNNFDLINARLDHLKYKMCVEQSTSRTDVTRTENSLLQIDAKQCECSIQNCKDKSSESKNDCEESVGASKVDCFSEKSCKTSADIMEDNVNITYLGYESESQMPDIMRLIQKDLSEPYSIYTYRYFIHNWPKLCFLAQDGNRCVGAIVCKLDVHKKHSRRGYIAMLAVDEKYRKRKIGSNLVLKAIHAMVQDNADEVVLETEITNKPALRLYENLGFVRDKRLFRYYLNGVDALRLKLWLR